MTGIILAIALAYVVMGVLLLNMGLSSRFAWWVKALVIVVTCGFFLEVFFATKSLLGWPGTGQLPPRFQLLWTRVVEPDPKTRDPGAIFLWVEELDDNNVPTGVPRSYRIRYTPPLAERSLKARDEIMAGNPQEGTASDMEAEESNQKTEQQAEQLNGPNRNDIGMGNIDLDILVKQAQSVEFRPLSGPALPAK
jgi:hypothetical protein